MIQVMERRFREEESNFQKQKGLKATLEIWAMKHNFDFIVKKSTKK